MTRKPAIEHLSSLMALTSADPLSMAQKEQNISNVNVQAARNEGIWRTSKDFMRDSDGTTWCEWTPCDLQCTQDSTYNNRAPYSYLCPKF